MSSLKWLTLVSVLACALSSQAAFANLERSGLQTVGQAKFKVMWFDVFKARLLTPSGEFESYQSELALELQYLRDFSQRQLLKATAKELERYASPAQMQPWMAKLERMWPAVKRDDRLSFHVTAEGHTQFYLNQRFLGRVMDKEFGPRFVKIWLGDNGSYPELAKALKQGALLE